MDRTSYNGWANRATWNVHLWLANDEWAYQQMRNQLAFWASRQTPKPEPKLDSHAVCLWAVSAVFGTSTPDGIDLSKRNTGDDAVDWAQLAAWLDEEYTTLYDEWIAEYRTRMDLPAGQRRLSDAAAAFRQRHAYNDGGRDLSRDSAVHQNKVRKAK